MYIVIFPFLYILILTFTIGSEYDKNEVVEDMINYHEDRLLNKSDLREILYETSKEWEVNGYLKKKYDKSFER